MYKKTITYTDYDGNVRTEEFLFHLTEAELAMLNLSYVGGLEKRIDRIVKSNNQQEIMRIFQDILHRSYGVKSDDGRRLIKNEQLFTEFEQTEAYSQFIIELFTDQKAAADFIQGILPKKLAEEVAKSNVTKLPDGGAQNK